MRIQAFVLLAAASLAACETPSPAIPEIPAGPAPITEVTHLECTVLVAERSLTCATPRPRASAQLDLITGGQGRYVFMQGSNVSFVPGSGSWSADVTIQNLMPQALGTTDGTTLHPNGVRVFFTRHPVVTAPVAGDGAITITNRTGVSTFTASNQSYFQYDEILSTNQTSGSLRWQFAVPPTATRFEFAVAVAAEVRYPGGYVDVTPPSDTLSVGSTATLGATVRDARGDPVPGAASVVWSSSDPAIVTVNASGTITATAPGTATLTATSGARTGSATVLVCPALGVGEVYVTDAAASICLGGGAAGAEYTVVPVNTSAVGSVALGVTGAGIVPVIGAPTPFRAPGDGLRLASSPAQPDHAFETRLRTMERRDLAGRGADRAALRAGPRASAVTPGVPAVGALMSLNVETDNSCSTNDLRTGRVVAVGTRAIILADTTNPAGGLTQADYEAIADTFDTRIHPVVAGTFGAPSDIDGNGRAVVFYTRAVNELTPPGSSSYVGGFFFARDLFAPASCPTSNNGEVFYMLTADPAGQVNGNVRSTSLILSQTFATLAHEYQHLINASRRMHVNGSWNGAFEEKWLEEGLSHIAEELVFYSASGLAPRGNTDVATISDNGVRQQAFFRYSASNFTRLRQWLLAPNANGPFHGNDNLATRGAAWAFLRYAADRRGTTDVAFFGGLVNTSQTGVANLQTALGTDPLPWFRDFAAAAYIDDAGGTPAAAYRNESWNFRSVFAALDFDPGPECTCAYPLAPRDPANGVTDSFSLVPGGSAAYLRMGVSANAFAAVTVRSGGATPPPTIRVAVTRRK